MKNRLVFLTLSIVTIVVMVQNSAVAETTSDKRVAFTWLRGDNAEECPDEATVAKDIATSLSSYSLSSDASRAIEAIVSRSNGKWWVRIYERVGQEARFFREFEDNAPNCAAITRAGVTVIKSLIESGSETQCPQCPQCPQQTQPTALRTTISARGAINYGLLPDLAGAFSLYTGVGKGRWEASVGMSWMPEISAFNGAEAFGMTIVSFGACFHLVEEQKVFLSTCGYFLAGGVTQDPWAGVAVAPRLRFPMGKSPLFIEAGADVILSFGLYNFDPENTYTGNALDQQSRFAVSGFLGMGVSIP